MTKRRAVRRFGCCALVLLAAGCSSAGGQSNIQTSTAEPDAGEDAPVTSPEPEPDSGPAPLRDAGLDAISVPDGAYDSGLVEEPYCANDDLTGDLDQDGWSVAEGDCNDCTALMNPGAFDYAGGVDENCDGVADEDALPCDEGLPVEADDPMDAVRAMGLCRRADPAADKASRSWGVLSARYVFVDGTERSLSKPTQYVVDCVGQGGEGAAPNRWQRGVWSRFGNEAKAVEGTSLLMLSTGVARPGTNGPSPGGAYMCTRSKTPPGFPTPSSAACPGQQIEDDDDAIDPIALEVELRVPSNAKSFSFDFAFFTYEFPGWICEKYNDFFVTLMWPSTAANHNICFDAQNNPVSVNNAFLEVCYPGNHGGKDFPCALGTSMLAGTGFEGHGSTGWLRTSSPVEPGSDIKLRFAIWDSGDFGMDSTVVLDNFQFALEQLPPLTQRPPK